MVNQLQNTRIRIKRIATDPELLDFFGTYSGFIGFEGTTIARILRDNIGCIPSHTLHAIYRLDPFEQNNTEDFTQYGFIECTFGNIENLSIENQQNRINLLQGETVSIIISPSETWNLSLCDRNINLLAHTDRSVTIYFIPQNQYDSNNNLSIISNNPFTANEREVGLGYRDAYFQIVILENL
jgi:hypothetical protein